MKKISMALVVMTGVALSVLFPAIESRSGSSAKGDENMDKLETVDYVDLGRYVGTWYEIASIPAWFQRKCASGTTATYTARDDGMIDVLNQCYEQDGKLRSAQGVAWVVDETTNAKLKVSFSKIFKKAFAGDYWIIELDPDYRYVVVGHPSRTYGWILSRTPELPAQDMEKIVKALEDKGYDFSDFVMTDQSGG